MQRVSWLLLVFSVATLGQSRVQVEQSISQSEHTLRVDVPLVIIPVTVRDRGDLPVFGLDEEDFRLYEDGIERAVVSAPLESTQISLNILLDLSGSMRPRNIPEKLWKGMISMGKFLVHEDSKVAVSIGALEQMLNNAYEDDVISFTTFARRTIQVGEFGITIRQLRQRMNTLEVGDSTWLNKSIQLVVREMKAYEKTGGILPTRKVLLIISDGVDSTVVSDKRVVAELQESGVVVYGVGMIENPKLFQKLARESGGRVVVVSQYSELSQVMAEVSRDMHNQYFIAFTPGTLDGKYHKVKITVPSHPEYKVLAKSGYTATTYSR